ncbi:MAG TPA: dihydrofolate reductase family protein [Thermoleophilia bacterium]|nr:dihydrofolate reductase family protein [Thermoleophilia bacterium]
MRPIIAGLFTSLDGVVEAPEKWQSPYFDNEMGQEMGQAMAEADALLLGRRTYETYAQAWPNAEGPVADFMNGVPKFVVSTTLESVGWQNSTLIKGDPGVEIAELKRRPGRSILVNGSATLLRSLVRYGLLDELRLMVCPVVVGEGRRLFDGWNAQVPVKLVRSQRFGTGVLALDYRIRREAEHSA